jgi:hypothetical protein
VEIENAAAGDVKSRTAEVREQAGALSASRYVVIQPECFRCLRAIAIPPTSNDHDSPCYHRLILSITQQFRPLLRRSKYVRYPSLSDG